MQGRKPKPFGMSTRRPDRPELDTGAVRLPPCPPHLGAEAKREWSRTGRKLLAAGLFTNIDLTALALYCVAWGRWVEAEEQLVNLGVIVKSPNGYPVQSPYLAIANKAMEQMTRLLAEFGMSPSSRTRVARTDTRRASAPVPAGATGADPREAMRVVR